MKKFLLLTVCFLAMASCKKEETTPKTRTVFFATASLYKTGREVRVMLDMLDTSSLEMIITGEVGRELGMSRFTPEYPDQLQAYCPYYDVVLYGGYGGGLSLLIDGIRYSPVGSQADLSRQERITGQHIDIVIGDDGFRRMFDRDLSKLPIDLEMVVPYDWGTSKE